MNAKNRTVVAIYFVWINIRISVVLISSIYHGLFFSFIHFATSIFFSVRFHSNYLLFFSFNIFPVCLMFNLIFKNKLNYRVNYGDDNYNHKYYETMNFQEKAWMKFLLKKNLRIYREITNWIMWAEGIQK